jgi:hypothetical protein
MSKRVTAILMTGLLGWGAFNPTQALGSEPPAEGRTFADALRALGWTVAALPDGSLQLSRSSGTSSTPELPAPPSPTAAQPEPSLAEGAWSVLRGYGWRVETNAQGATLLYPPSAATPSAQPAPEPERPEAQSEVAQDLNAILAERGWRVERAADGSLSLFPLRRSDSVGRALAASVGSLPPAVADGTVRLPVNTWDEARAVALSWLASVGDPGLRLGKIWRIQRLYLVSIDQARAPHDLRHQISIDVDDGRVLVLN